MKLLKDYKIEPLVEYDDFNTYKYAETKKISAIWIDGSDVGKKVSVYLLQKSKQNDDGKVVVDTLAAEISVIKQRTKRAAELDAEKVWNKISLFTPKVSGCRPKILPTI